MLEIKNLSAVRGSKTILDDISLHLLPHTLTVITGKNGCGKSTLVSCINRELEYSGKILIDGMDTAVLSRRERAKRIGILPQVLPVPDISVQELVMFGRSPYLDFTGRPSKNDKAAIKKAMEITGIAHLANKNAAAVSGGERQKAYLAMIIAQDTDVLVLDEPATFTDISYSGELLKTLLHLKKYESKTILVIMHDISQALRFADNIAVMNNGKIAFCGSPAKALESKIIESVFGVEAHIFQKNYKNYIVFE